MYKFDQAGIKQFPSGLIEYTESINQPVWNKFQLADAIGNYMGIEVELTGNIEVDEVTWTRFYHFEEKKSAPFSNARQWSTGGYKGL